MAPTDQPEQRTMNVSSPLDLSALTANASKAGYMERMLDRNAASYKYYWMRSIIDEVSSGNESISYVRLVARMTAHAWYPVVYYHLNLGTSDKLSTVINHIRTTYELPNDCPQEQIVQLIEANYHNDKTLAKLVEERTGNVPYRLIRPFYADGLAKAKKADPKWNDPKTDYVIFYLNQKDPDVCFYRILPDRDGIEVNSEWSAFIRDNLPVISGWLDYRLTQYLQSRNPSVPAIPLKLHAPVQRELKAATQYWSKAIEVCQLKEIYTGHPFTREHFERHGALSIDHFVPWSFVLHDEPWNLTPMFRHVNSSKGDKLPNLALYLEPFCQQQFNALLALRHDPAMRKTVESYLQIDPHVHEYAQTDASRDSFAEALVRTVTPLYQIALNQGYATWEYR